jgi:phage baseplate assembly protein W
MAISISQESKRFVDVSLSFEPNPITGDLTTLTNERSINNSLKNLIMIAATEVPFNAEIGSGVPGYLFEVVDEGTAELLQQEIERVIKFSEPRVELVSPMGAEVLSNYKVGKVGVVNNEFNEIGTEFNPLDDSRTFINRFAPVFVESRPDQNAFMVTITYKIVGYEQVVTFNQLLEPTR